MKMCRAIFSNKYKMIKINANTYAKNCIYAIKVIKKDNKLVLWIKRHDIQEKIDLKVMSDPTIKAIKSICNTKSPTKEQIRKYKRHGKEFINGLTGIYIRKNLALSIIMDCRKSRPNKFRSKLRFTQHDLKISKEHSAFTKNKSVLERRNIATTFNFTTCNILSYKFELYFLELKLVVKINKKVHIDQDIHTDINRQKKQEGKLIVN